MMSPRQIQDGTDPLTVPAQFEPGHVWQWPLTGLERRVDRILTRLIARVARAQIPEISHWERLLPDHDPFILIANHSSRREALYLGTLCLLLRSGKPVRFLADWNFRLIPGVGYLYDRSGVITIARKPARPRFLNRFKRRFMQSTSPFDQARATLAAGGAVGFFPEGTVNRDASRLLPGRIGAARLSIETQAPVLPVGLRFAGRRRDGLIDSNSPFRIEVGVPMSPPHSDGTAPPQLVQNWHQEIMAALAPLCGKASTNEIDAQTSPEQRAQNVNPVSGPPNGARGGSVC